MKKGNYSTSFSFSPAIVESPIQAEFDLPSISQQIKKKNQSFMLNYHEFKSLQTSENLLKEFEELVVIEDVLSKINRSLLKLSKVLRINKNNELDLMDHIVIFRTVEKKIANKKFSIIITVK